MSPRPLWPQQCKEVPGDVMHFALCIVTWTACIYLCHTSEIMTLLLPADASATISDEKTETFLLDAFHE